MTVELVYCIRPGECASSPVVEGWSGRGRGGEEGRRERTAGCESVAPAEPPKLPASPNPP
jgi:hypothetical protein